MKPSVLIAVSISAGNMRSHISDTQENKVQCQITHHVRSCAYMGLVANVVTGEARYTICLNNPFAYSSKQGDRVEWKIF